MNESIRNNSSVIYETEICNNVKLNVSLVLNYVIKHHAMKAYRGVQV
jgi:hypothetical protein